MKTRLRQGFWPVFVGVFLVAASFWQLSAVFGAWDTSYLGSGELEGWLWRYWWMKQMLFGVWHATVPVSYALWVTAAAGSYPETGNVFDLQFLSLPLEALFGAPRYYNVKCLLALILNGWAGYCLGKTVLRSRLGAFVSALVLAVSPYVLSEIANGRVRQALVFPLAFYALYLVKLWRNPNFATAVATGIWGGLSSAVYLYYGMTSLMFTIIVVGWWALTAAEGRISWKRLGFGLLALVIVVMGSLPFGISYLQRQSSGEQLPELMWQRDFLTLDELVNPNVETVLKQNDPLLNSLQRFRSDSLPWQYAFMPRYSRNYPWVFATLALLAWPMALLVSWKRRRSQAQSDQATVPMLTAAAIFPWLAASLYFYLLTLGPYIKDGITGTYLASETGGLASPYVWIFKYFPAFARLFSPVRMSGGLMVCSAVLAGYSAQFLLGGPRLPKFIRAAGLIVVALLSLHGLQVCGALPLNTSRIAVPDYYYRLAKEPFCTIVELPFRTGDSLQYFQTVHEKKLLLGWSDGAVPPGYPSGSRVDAYTRVFEGLQESTFLKFLEGLNVHPENPLPYTAKDFDYVASTGLVRRIIVHERGCWQVSQQNGNQHYRDTLEALEKHFGPPIDYCQEYVYERGPEPRVFEMAVFAVKPETKGQAAFTGKK